jgi:serine/threonine-protein kinase
MDREASEYTAYVLRRQGRLAEAIGIMDSLIATDPRDIRLAWNQAVNLAMVNEFEKAEQLYELALILQPTSLPARSYYIDMLLMGEGDIERAREVNERPPGFIDESAAAGNRFWSFYFLRDYTAAIEAVRDVEGGALKIPTALGDQTEEQRALLIALAQAMAGDESGARFMADSAVAVALAELKRRPITGAVDRFGFTSAARSSLALALALRGREGDAEEAIRHAREAVRLYGLTVDAYEGQVAEWTLAQVFALTGRHDHALNQLAGLLENPSRFGVGALRLDPIWDPIRDDPRFQEIVKDRENFSIR